MPEFIVEPEPKKAAETESPIARLWKRTSFKQKVVVGLSLVALLTVCGKPSQTRVVAEVPGLQTVSGSVSRDDIDTHETDSIVAVGADKKAGSITIKAIDISTGEETYTPNCQAPKMTMVINAAARWQQTTIDSKDCRTGKEYTSTLESWVSLIQTADGAIVIRTSDNSEQRPWLDDWMLDAKTSKKILDQFSIPKTKFTATEFQSWHAARYGKNFSNWQQKIYDAEAASPPDLTVHSNVAVADPALYGYDTPDQVWGVDVQKIDETELAIAARNGATCHNSPDSISAVKASYDFGFMPPFKAKTNMTGGNWFWTPIARCWINEKDLADPN